MKKSIKMYYVLHMRNVFIYYKHMAIEIKIKMNKCIKC